MAKSFNIFDKIAAAKPTYSRFDLSHEHKLTFNAGKIIPLLWFEGVPGDTFKVSGNFFIRSQALLSPMMHMENFRVRFYKIPLNTIVSRDDLESAFTGGQFGEHIDFPMSECVGENMTIGSLYDYLGLPLPYYFDEGSWIFDGDSQGFFAPNVSPFPFLAYHRIFNDWLRNPETSSSVCESNLDGDLTFGTNFEQLSSFKTNKFFTDVNGSSTYSLDDLHSIGWERDYFTSALSSSQRGSEIHIPLVGQAPVSVNSESNLPQGMTYDAYLKSQGSSITDPTKKADLGIYDSQEETFTKMSLLADLSQTSGIGAIALRTYMNLQAFRERANVAGYRLKEWIYSMFGVQSSDKSLVRSQYLGGASFPVSVTQVTQMSASQSGSTPQGHLTGNSSVIGSMNKPIIIKCDTPCIIMAVGWVLPKTGYSQGLSRAWTRKDFTEYFNPFFESIGEQEILNRELFYQFSASFGDPNDNENTWAFQSRYSEYKYMPDTIAGDFRTNLSYWHKSRIFSELPSFNDDFVTCHPTDRTFAVGDDVSDQHYLADIYWNIKAVRPMKKYATSKIW